MPIQIKNFRKVSRRRFLSSAATSAVGVIAMPYLSRAADRPILTHGVQSGDVSADARRRSPAGRLT